MCVCADNGYNKCSCALEHDDNDDGHGEVNSAGQVQLYYWLLFINRETKTQVDTVKEKVYTPIILWIQPIQVFAFSWRVCVWRRQISAGQELKSH